MNKRLDGSEWLEAIPISFYSFAIILRKNGNPNARFRIPTCFQDDSIILKNTNV